MPMTNNKLYARDDYLKKKAADSNGLNIQLTNIYAFRKTFKNTYIAKGSLMALLGLKEDEIADLKVTDPFEEGESEQEKEGILDIKTGEEYNDKLQFHVVQLKKLEMLPRKKKKRNYTIGQNYLQQKIWKEVDDTIKGNPYREAVKDEMYKNESG